MENKVEYITAIIDGLQQAIPKAKIRELHSAHIIKYSTISLKKYIDVHLRVYIINELMSSSLSRYFDNLSYTDMLQILGKSMTKSSLFKTMLQGQRVLTSPSFRDKLQHLQELQNTLNELKELE